MCRSWVTGGLSRNTNTVFVKSFIRKETDLWVEKYDVRDHSRSRLTPQRAALLQSKADELSGRLPGMQKVRIGRINPGTGKPRLARCRGGRAGGRFAGLYPAGAATCAHSRTGSRSYRNANPGVCGRPAGTGDQQRRSCGKSAAAIQGDSGFRRRHHRPLRSGRHSWKTLPATSSASRRM